MSTLKSLPTEILIKIFTNLNNFDLLALTKACKRFNEIISAEQQLVDKLILHFTKGKIRFAWKPLRKYSYLHVGECSEDEYKSFKNVLKKFGENITKIDLGSNIRTSFNVKSSTLLKVFNCCPNIKEIHLFFHFDESTGARVNTLNVNKLKMRGSRTGFQLFHQIQAKKIQIYFDDDPCRYFDKLIRNQTDLRVLKMATNGQEYFTIYFGEVCKNLKFPLEILKLNFINIDEVESFRDFINNFTKTLTEIQIQPSHSIEIFNCFAKLENLTKLSYQGIRRYSRNSANPWMRELQTFETVTDLNLVLHQDFNYDFAEKFPNLKILKLSGAENRKLGKLSVGDLKKLKELSITRFVVREVEHFPKTLKILEICDVYFWESPNFDGMEIEVLKLSECDVDWLRKFFDSNTKLKKFSAFDVKFKVETATAIAKQEIEEFSFDGLMKVQNIHEDLSKLVNDESLINKLKI